MAIKPFQAGQHRSLEFFENCKLTRHTSDKSIASKKVIRLLKNQYHLNSTSSAHLKTKVIGLINDGSLTVALSAILGSDAAVSKTHIKSKATSLRQRLSIIQSILEKQGIAQKKCREMTQQLDKAIGRVLDSEE